MSADTPSLTCLERAKSPFACAHGYARKAARSDVVNKVIFKVTASLPTAQSQQTASAESRAVGAVIAAGKWASDRHWVPATSGNFSARIDARTIAITRSGPHKGKLTPDDILIVDLDTPDARASAEAPLHYALYLDHPEIAAIYHFHSPAASVLSRVHEKAGEIVLSGWELQKAFSGITTHESNVVIPVLANAQDTVKLADEARARFAARGTRFFAPGYLLAGHGLYAWGNTIEDARRHAEAIETLLAMQLDYERLVS